MNILFISRNSPYESIGGIERYLTNLIAYYKTHARGEVNLFLMLPTSTEDVAVDQGNVKIILSENLSLSRTDITSKKIVADKAQLFSEEVAKIIKDNKVDIICAENFHSDLPAAYSLLLNMLAMSQKIPLILQLHSFATTELQSELINQLKWDRISCVSKSVAGDCFQKGTDIDYLATHYLGVNTEKFNTETTDKDLLKKKLYIPAESTIILTATRILRGKTNILQQKGIINLVEAFSKISPKYPHLKLLIAIGRSRENLKNEFDIAYKMLQGYIQLHNVEENTILHLFELEEMPDVYRGSDMFVLASQNETFGQVFIEAMSCGLPVIGTKVGGVPEIITDSYNGYLIRPDDASILAQRIETLLDNTKLREDFIKAGLNTVAEQFTAEKQFADFHKMLEEAVVAA